MHRFASQLVEIYVNVNIMPLTMLGRPLETLWQRLMVDHHLCPALLSLLSRGWWIPKLSQRQRAALVLITFSCKPSLYANFHLKQKWSSNQCSACDYWKYCSDLRSWALSKGDVKKHWGVIRFLLKQSYLRIYVTYVKLIRRSGRVPGRLVAAVYRTRYPNWCPDWLLAIAAAAYWLTDTTSGTITTRIMCFCWWIHNQPLQL